MPYDPERHQRRSVRWRGHDDAAGGTYFVTVCAFDRACLFGAVRDDAMVVDACGLVVEREWVRSGEVRTGVDIDIFAVMPNHLHGLVTIRVADEPPVPAHRCVPGLDDTDVRVKNDALRGRDGAHSGVPLRRPRSLSSLVGQFKATTTRAINEARGTPGAKVWQRGFHERVVRDERAFANIAAYIATNPERWAMDTENPDGAGDDDLTAWLARP